MTATHTHTQHIRVMRVMCLMASVNNTRSMLAFVSLYSANAESRIPDSLVKSSAWSYLKRSNKRVHFMKLKVHFSVSAVSQCTYFTTLGSKRGLY